MSLFKKIIISFLLVSIVPITIFGFFIVNKVFNIIQEKVFEANASVTQQISWQLDTYFETVQKLLESLALLPEVKDFEKEKIDALLNSYYTSYTIYYGHKTLFEATPFESFTVLDNKGIVRTVCPLKETRIGLNYFDQTFFQEVSRTKKIYFSSDIVISESTGEPIIKIAVPVLGENGDISSVVEADIGLESIIQLTSQVKAGETGYLFTINKDGFIITHPDEELVLQHQNIENINPGLLSMLLKKDYSERIVFYPQEKPEIIIAYSLPKTVNWILLLSQSSSEALAAPLSIRIQFILILFLVIFFVILITFYLSRGITGPLKKLTEKVVEIGITQELESEIDIKTGDEIEELGSSFNQMMKRLKTKTAELEKRTEELQRRKTELEEKTTELQKIKEDLEKFYKLTVGRELRMIELKKKIRELEKKLETELPPQ